MNTAIVITLGIFILLILCFTFVLLILNIKKASPRTNTATKELNLDQILTKVGNPKLSANQLHELILSFINTQKLPFKGSNLSAEAKKKLNFVSLVAMHPNTNAREITFLNKELVKRYPSYQKEIDAYEGIGLSKRKMRESKN